MPSTTLSLSQIGAPEIHQGHAYWRQLRQGRLLPARCDIDPVDIPDLLPYVQLSDVFDAPLRVRYRLVGSHICEISGWDPTGCWMDRTSGFEREPAWRAQYRTMLDSRAPLFGREALEFRGFGELSYEWAILPLSSDGGRIDMTFEFEVYDRSIRQTSYPDPWSGRRRAAG